MNRFNALTLQLAGLEAQANDLRNELRIQQSAELALSCPMYVNLPMAPCTDEHIDTLCAQEMAA